MESSKSWVLVTGATGYLAGYVIKELLEANYRVRGSVRKLADKQKYAHLFKLPKASPDTLDFVEAELSNTECWEAACKDCLYVIHVAFPLLLKTPKDPVKEIIQPAVQGTINVLNAALKAGVKKVVVTSSSSTVHSGHGDKTNEMIFNETIWSNIEFCTPYEKGKMLAEKEAWKFYEANKDKIEVSVIIPGYIIGPVLSKNVAASPTLVIRILKNEMPGLPVLSFPFVDVRDVAHAHVLAMENPNATGKRFLIANKTLLIEEVAKILKKEFANKGYKIPTRKVGKCPLKFAALFDSEVRLVLDYVGKFYRIDNSKSVEVLGMKYIGIEESLIEMAYSLIEHGIVPKKSPKK